MWCQLSRRALVPAGVVEHQMDLFAFFGRDLFGHGVEEGLENLGVAVGDDQADQATRGGLDCADNVAPQMPAVIALGGTAAALDPFVARTRIAFKSRLVAEEDHRRRIF